MHCGEMGSTKNTLSSSTLLHDASTPRDPQSNCHLFRLPREIRDFIYIEYVTVQGSYMYDVNHSKLVQAEDGGEINVGLMHSCHRTWKEMEGLPLRENKITFRASCTPESSARAGVLHAALHRIEQAQWYKLCIIGPEFLTEGIIHKIGSEFPYFRPVVDGLKALGGQDIENQIVFNEYSRNSWGKPPSIYREFLQRLFELVSQHPDWAFRSQQYVKNGRVDGDFAGSVPEPWSVLETQDVEHIKNGLYPGQGWQETAFTWPSDTYVTSAAALAIKFFDSIPVTTRKYIRAIELVEDRAAVAYPACHMRGFIPFCKENPALRIQRLVNVWKNILPVGYLHPNLQGRIHFRRSRITEHVAEWLVEATELPALGMPKECFTLTLDGAPLPAEATQIFDFILEDSAEQAAMDSSFPKESLHNSQWLERRIGEEENLILYFEGLPEAIQDLKTGNKGIVGCNFEISSRIDQKQIIQQHNGWLWQDWQRKRYQRLDELGPLMPSQEYLRNDRLMNDWRHRVCVRNPECPVVQFG